MVKQIKDIVVLGGSGLVARHLVSHLAASDCVAHVVGRTKPQLPAGFVWIPTKKLRDGDFSLAHYDCVIGLWPIWLVAEIVEELREPQHLITLSSTSKHSYGASRDPTERKIAKDLACSETKITEAARRSGLVFTIMRPTLIYDGVSDQSISKIANVIRRFGFFVIAGRGSGLRQPIHASDVAEAIVRSINCASVRNQAFDVTGGETLTFRTMIERVALGLGKTPRILCVPSIALRWLVMTLKLTGLTYHGPGFVDRMNEHLVFDGSDAVKHLGIEPRKFYPLLRRDF